ncbi:hypothetical protein BST97_11705 [Nonlabens spongiae]|uniref:Translation initiation factor IF-2 n=1 Tax=Nonlabens spongiae TaxID=331648 RepID=A0A1W6MLX8_9FLAO|nr:SPOR domain-containing protein [Nonlabens spongiae]ARN78598.1 hypothetical protein BST97_11705 [Nonlabens spongiae]
MQKLLSLNLLICLLFTSIPFISQGQNSKKIEPNTLTELIETKQKLDQTGKLKDRYTIQLYYGNREKATKMKRDYEALALGWKCDLFWESPNLAVRVGKFRNRLEADQALIIVREQFPNAIVMKP